MASVATPPPAAPSAPPPSAPASTPSGGNSSPSIFDQIGEALNGSDNSGSSQTENPEPASAQPSEQAAPGATSDSTAGADATAAPVAEVEQPKTDEEKQTEAALASANAEPENPYDQYDLETEEVPKQTLDQILATPRGKEIYQNHKFLQEISQPVEKGGIGFKPTLDQVKQFFGSYRDRMLMETDLNSGSPEGINRYLTSYLFSNARGQAGERIASQIAPALAKHNPELYAAVSEPILATYQNALVDRASQADAEGNTAVRDACWYAASIINKDRTGKYLEPKGQQNSAAKVDPFAEERAELAAERARIDSARAQEAQTFTQRWDAGAAQTIGASLGKELDQALKPLQNAYVDKPRAYNALRKEFHDQIAAVVQRGPQWPIFQAVLKQARATGTPEAIQQLAQQYIRMAQPVIAANRKKFLEEAGVAFTKQSEAQHSDLRQVDSRKTVNGSGGTPQAATPAPLTRNPGESDHDFVLRQLRA